VSAATPLRSPAGTGLPNAAGVGLKPQHFPDIVGPWPAMGFFEIHAENYFVGGGPMHERLGRIRERYALSVHGVGLSIGGECPLDAGHLAALQCLVERYQPEQVSEHLAWSSHGGAFFNDLLPVPYDDMALDRICAHIDQAQHTLGRRILLENPATYVEFAASTYSEAEFISAILRRTGCGLLLDVNNAYVACSNHGRDPLGYLMSLPLAAVGEIHLAGFAREADSLGAPLLIDDHGREVDAAVWRLYEQVIAAVGPAPTLIEWDNDVPGFERLAAEADRAQLIMDAGRRCEAVA
jgi:hypothetical protein